MNRNPLHLKPTIFNLGRLLRHDDPSLEHTDCINITFEIQKKDKRTNTTTLMSSCNVTLCPVQAAAAIVRRIKSYPRANNNTPISAIWMYNQIKHIISTQIRNVLQDAVKAMGEDTLLISVNKIETHSIRSRAAMAMFLCGCPVFIIMMIGCCSSDAFLRYICKQVKEFNHNVLQKMLTHVFHRHIPNYLPPTVYILTQCNATIPTMSRQESV